MGEVGPRLERILIVLTVGVLAIVAILVYRMPGIMCCMNHVYILLGGLVLSIVLLILISQAIECIHLNRSNKENECMAKREDLHKEYEKEKNYIMLKSLSKQKELENTQKLMAIELENKKQLMAVELENYKQKELFKKENGLD